MFILSTFFEALARVLDPLLQIYAWVIIARALISWVNPDPYNPIVQFLYKVTEPVLIPFRRLIPVYNIGIDLSPILAIFAIYFLKYFLVSILLQIAQHLS
jgi:YggT family protein